MSAISTQKEPNIWDQWKDAARKHPKVREKLTLAEKLTDLYMALLIPAVLITAALPLLLLGTLAAGVGSDVLITGIVFASIAAIVTCELVRRIYVSSKHRKQIEEDNGSFLNSLKSPLSVNQ